MGLLYLESVSDTGKPEGVTCRDFGDVRFEPNAAREFVDTRDMFCLTFDPLERGIVFLDCANGREWKVAAEHGISGLTC